MVDKQMVPLILARLGYYADRHGGEFTQAVLHDCLKDTLRLTPMETGAAMYEYEPYLREQAGYIEYGPAGDYILTEEGKRDAIK